jgi:hypothetical protein
LETAKTGRRRTWCFGSMASLSWKFDWCLVRLRGGKPADTVVLKRGSFPFVFRVSFLISIGSPCCCRPVLHRGGCWLGGREVIEICSAGTHLALAVAGSVCYNCKSHVLQLLSSLWSAAFAGFNRSAYFAGLSTVSSRLDSCHWDSCRLTSSVSTTNNPSSPFPIMSRMLTSPPLNLITQLLPA